MEIHELPAAMSACCRRLRARGSLGLVPTMGALHAGHMSLIAASRGRDAASVASIFVNPTQFGPGEDYHRYPRPREADLAMLEQAGVAAVFLPTPAVMYPDGYASYVEVEGYRDRLCGRSRPGHFRGVATVVLKLQQIVQPQRAYFGQKDAAQVAVLRRMFRDLNCDVEMVVCPIVREPDGLALSSRNQYLSPAERQSALALSRALHAIAQAYSAGQHAAASLLASGRKILAAEAGLRLDYLEAVHAETLLPVENAEHGTLIAAAAWAGSTRLIDNCLLD